ncbi:MAG: hypothetical protein AAGJ08_29215 [Cyanobacteria bacterium P01_H01_bin.35]
MENSQETKNQPQLYLAEAPQDFNCYDRSSELTTLENWILKDSSRLIALLGISGIGKTTLTLQLIKQIETNFNYIIYRSLRFSPSLNTTLAKLLEIFSDRQNFRFINIRIIECYTVAKKTIIIRHQTRR